MDETNFITVEAPALIGIGVQSIVEQARQLGLTWTFQPGTVGAADGNMVTVMFDGDSVAVNCLNLSDVVLTAGTRVMGILTPTGNYVISGIGGPLSPASNLSLESFGGLSVSTTSATFINMSGAVTGTFVKRSSGTAIKVTMDLTFYSLASGSGVEYAVQINGTDYVIARLLDTNASLLAHTTVAGVRKIASGLSAGSYVVTPRVRRTSGTGTITMDNGDNAFVYLEEVAA